MGCGSCSNRRGLFKRTIQNVVRTIENNRTSNITVTPVKNQTCNIKVVLKSTGYVAHCSTHGTSGNPSAIPDQAKVECNDKSDSK